MSLDDHRAHLNTVKQQRRLLDESYARAIADAIKDGHSIQELLADPDTNQMDFDL